MNFPIIESVSGLLAAIAAYFSIRAKKEAGEANNAVNHTQDGSPRWYDLALSNYKAVTRIKERQDARDNPSKRHQSAKSNSSSQPSGDHGAKQATDSTNRVERANHTGFKSNLRYCEKRDLATDDAV